MRRPRLPIEPLAMSRRRRGRERGKPAPHPVSPPPLVPGGRTSHPDNAGAPLPGEPLLLEARQVARLLGIGRTKVYQLIARRELPVICIGRCVRVPRADLQAWIATRTDESLEAPRR